MAHYKKAICPKCDSDRLIKSGKNIFEKLKENLDLFEISRYYTDDWGAYARYLDAGKHEIGKRNTQ